MTIHELQRDKFNKFLNSDLGKDITILANNNDKDMLPLKIGIEFAVIMYAAYNLGLQTAIDALPPKKMYTKLEIIKNIFNPEAVEKAKKGVGRNEYREESVTNINNKKI